MFITILGKKWKFREVSTPTFLKKEPPSLDSTAFVDFHKRTVWFRPGQADLINIRHELWHIFFESTHTESAGLSPEQVEETSASMFASKVEVMVYLSNQIYEGLKNE